MSEQNINIATGAKAKDPRRVAAGKRLAAISKQAKEAKRLRQEGEMDSAYVQEETGTNKTLYLVGGLVVVGAVSYLLFANKEKVVQTFSGDKKESDPVPEQELIPKRKIFKSVFDD